MAIQLKTFDSFTEPALNNISSQFFQLHFNRQKCTWIRQMCGGKWNGMKMENAWNFPSNTWMNGFNSTYHFVLNEEMWVNKSRCWIPHFVVSHCHRVETYDVEANFLFTFSTHPAQRAVFTLDKETKKFFLCEQTTNVESESENVLCLLGEHSWGTGSRLSTMMLNYSE